jgi:Kef-type K+ transport system membrane component KefB
MRYLYYTVYRLLLKIKTNDTPAFNAMLLVSILEAINIQTVFLLIPDCFKLSLPIKEQVLFYAVGVVLILFAINYFYLIKKLPMLVDKYRDENRKQKNIANVLLVTIQLFPFF